MSVKELIKALLDAGNLDRLVCVYDQKDNMLYNITLVDLSISDRVDINFGSAERKDSGIVSCTHEEGHGRGSTVVY